MKLFQVTVWPSALLLLVGSCAAYAQIEYAPSLETGVESIIEIGIERSGQREVVVNTKRKTTVGDRREYTNTLKDIKVNSIEESRTKSTNPNKRKTRPKPSGMFGGVVRAFGGDYSGLAEFGLGFVDHMMEPKYNWDVEKIYYTKESRETAVTSNITTDWDKKQEFETTVKQTYSTNINKGFMKFSVAVRNIGERSVRIKSPEFVIHFVNPDEELVYIDQVRPEQDSGVPISIAPGQSRIFGLTLKNRDFITLSQQYRDAIGVRVTMQDLFVEGDGGQLRSMAEAQEDLEDTHVRVDYFDGTNRSIRFFPVPETGTPLDAFLEQVLANKSYQLNPEVQPDSVVDNLIHRIGSLESDNRVFSELTRLRDRYDWRRWFITVSDDESTYFDARRGDNVFPGYSVRLGYYSADQVLPPEQYRPIIFEKANVILQPNRPFDIPIDLKPGDIVVFEDVELQDFTINQVRFSATPKTLAQVNAAATSQQGRMFTYSVFSPSPAQSLMKFNTPVAGPTIANHLYLLEPQQVITKKISPSLLVRYKSMSNQDVPMSVKNIIGWMTAMEGFRNSFTHIDGAFKLDFSSKPFNTGHFSGVPPDHLLWAMGMVQRPGETAEDFIGRELLEEEQFLTFVVEENVRADDSKWLFASPPLTVWSAYIRSSTAQLNPTLYGAVLGNYGQYAPMSFTSGHMTGMPMWGGMLGGHFTPPAANRDQALYDIIALSRDSAITDLPDSYGVERIDYSSSLSLLREAGPKVNATLRVIRYRKN